MTQELRIRNQSQSLFNRALTTAYRNGVQIYDPSIWLMRDPDAEEKMLRDADIAHAVGYRRHLIAGRQWNLTPRDDTSETSELAVKIGEELLGHVPHFTQARFNLARAFFSGSRFARIHGRPEVLDIGDGRRRTWWVPTRLEDIDKRNFRIVPDMDIDGGQLAAHWERWDVGVGDWGVETTKDATETIRHVYADDQATLGHGRALREAIGWWWYAKEHVFQESLQAVERFAQGIIHAKINGVRDATSGKPNATLITEWQDLLEDLRARHVLVSDRDDEVEIISPSAEGWQMLSTMREELRSTIFTLVLGANLTTSANEGGSYALAEIQENSTEALIQYDRETLEETLTDDLLGCLWKKNLANVRELGIGGEMPRFAITQEKRTDPKERAEVFEIANRMGLPLATDDIYEQLGTRKPDEEEDILAGAIPGGLHGDGFGSGVPGFGVPATDPLGAPTPVGADIGGGTIGEPIEIQETAMNGAQVTAAAELVVSVVQGTMPPGTAVRMLVSMFNLPQPEAQAMIDEAVRFTPAAPPTAAPAEPAVESTGAIA